MIYKLNIEALYCVGDIHGALQGIDRQIKKYDLRNCALIFCGDVGFGFEKKEYYEQTYLRLRPLLSKRNMYLLFVRGNHDDPDLFDGKKIAHKRFVAVTDYSVIQAFDMDDATYTTPMRSVLCVGGAISVDRVWRKQRMMELAIKYKRSHSCDMDHALSHSQKLWWDNEAPVFDAKILESLYSSGVKIDTICTHTCPSVCEPRTKDGLASFVAFDPSLEADVKEERQTMDMLWKHLKDNGNPLKMWCYGHYHYHYFEEIECVRFCMLDMERNGGYDIVEIR